MTEILIALVALTVMEIVLGIDNIVFITILAGKLPANQQGSARRLGLILALGTRLALLATLSYVVHQLNKTPLFELTSMGIPEALLRRLGSVDETSAGASHHFDMINGVTWRDLILFLGGLFLIWKSVREIHHQFGDHDDGKKPGRAEYWSVIAQIALLDIVFSLDSVITAVGMVQDIWIMVAAIILAIGAMLIFAGPISRVVSSQPTIKMLALSFLILIGVVLVADSIGAHLDKGYIYFAMAFAICVEGLNIAFRRTTQARLVAGSAAQRVE
jgi:predicted tellurium resistance membrane protein TerC